MPKPKFDPSAPFEAVGKPRFDPSQPFDEVSEPEPAQEPDVPLGEQAKSLFESTIVDQLPALGAATGGLIGGVGGSIAGAGFGGVPGALGGAGVGGYTGKALQDAYNSKFRPERAPKDVGEVLLGPVKSGAEGVATEGVGLGVGKAVGAVARGIGSKIPSRERVVGFLKNKAGSLAEKATGATRVQAEKFSEGTGQKLLDRGLVKFGDAPKDIANRSQSALDAAQLSKEDIVKNKLQGVNVDRNKVYAAVRDRIKELSGDESQVDLVRKLESKLDDIVGVAEKSSSEVPLSKSEEVRRGFDKAAKWDSVSDAPTREANKIVASAYREAGEEAANSANPALGSKFKEDKLTQHLLIPVQEAAEKRAVQLNQSPYGGLLDLAAVGGGGTIGATLDGSPESAAAGGLVGLIAKALRPRYASMGAASLNALAKRIAVAAKSDPKAAALILQRMGHVAGSDSPPSNVVEIIRKSPGAVDAAEDDSVSKRVKRSISSKKGGKK